MSGVVDMPHKYVPPPLELVKSRIEELLPPAVAPGSWRRQSVQSEQMPQKYEQVSRNTSVEGREYAYLWRKSSIGQGHVAESDSIRPQCPEIDCERLTRCGRPADFERGDLEFGCRLLQCEAKENGNERHPASVHASVSARSTLTALRRILQRLVLIDAGVYFELEPVLDAIRAEVAFFRRARVRIDEELIVRTRDHTRAAADACVAVQIDDAIVAAKERTGRTDLHARRFFALIAEDRQKKTPRVGKCSAFRGLDPAAIRANWNVVLRFARNRARVTADALFQIDRKAVRWHEKAL